VLSVGVLLAWQMFYAGPKLKEDQERRQRVQRSRAAQERGRREDGRAPLLAQHRNPGAAVPSRLRVTCLDTRRGGAATARAHRDPSFARLGCAGGGRLETWCGQVSRDGRSDLAHVVLSRRRARRTYYAGIGWSAGTGVTQPMRPRHALAAEKDAPLTPASPVTLVWDNGRGCLPTHHRRRCDYLFPSPTRSSAGCSASVFGVPCGDQRVGIGVTRRRSCLDLVGAVTDVGSTAMVRRRRPLPVVQTSVTARPASAVILLRPPERVAAGIGLCHAVARRPSVFRVVGVRRARRREQHELGEVGSTVS